MSLLHHALRGLRAVQVLNPKGHLGLGRAGLHTSESAEVIEVFNRPLKWVQRDRAASINDLPNDALHTTVSEALLDRLEDCVRRFRTVLVLGGAVGAVTERLAGGRSGIERVICVDPSLKVLEAVAARASAPHPRGLAWPALQFVAADEEMLPLAPHSVDLVVSCLGLHWLNDLPGAMAQARTVLRPDGLFLAAMLGGETLHELRSACALGHLERLGGVSPVMSPLAQVRDAGNLLTRAGLAMPTVDADSYRFSYSGVTELVEHLRSIGETNASLTRQHALNRDAALAAAAVYQSQAGPDGRISATYQVMYMTGWSPAPAQPRAARRGSATVSFQELADGLIQQGATGGYAQETPQEPR